ncbi:Holo-[acyl-carrier-protein] synthase [Pseudoclavibacter triregionum]|nr:Holo-[acyl-carrier-protein] synthase [Pseudoclavibacter triregionum]
MTLASGPAGMPGVPGLPAASGAIAGIGVDVVDVTRLEGAIERSPRFLERVFAPGERELPPRSLAARWAAREAAMKAIGGLGGISLLDLEVVRRDGGEPAFARGPRLARELERRGICALHLSMTHDGPVAIAFVVAERAAPPSGGAASGPPPTSAA